MISQPMKLSVVAVGASPPLRGFIIGDKLIRVKCLFFFFGGGVHDINFHDKIGGIS